MPGGAAGVLQECHEWVSFLRQAASPAALTWISWISGLSPANTARPTQQLQHPVTRGEDEEV